MRLSHVAFVAISHVIGAVTCLFYFIYYNSVIYYMGYRGRLWQVHSTYLNKRKVQKSTERKKRQMWKRR